MKWAVILAIFLTVACTSHQPGTQTTGREMRPASASRHGTNGTRIWTIESVRLAVSSEPGIRVNDGGPIILATDVPEQDALGLLNELLAVRASVVAELFERPPTRTVAIFCGATSIQYVRLTRHVTGEEPWSGAGFFTRQHFALFLNYQAGALGTGGHELTHALIAEDWDTDDCPIWLNEGIASVWEWPVLIAPDHYVGGPEHRRVQVREKGPVSVASLFRASKPSATSDDFSGPDAARYQATARLLCVYLQERGLLTKLYHGMKTARAENQPWPDRTRKLVECICREPLEAVERGFRQWLTSPAQTP